MLRSILIGLAAMLAILAGDLLFRTSLLRLVHPVIVEPTDAATVTPPVRLRWEGPRQMQVTLRYAGRERWDLGIHESPFEIPPAHTGKRGLYSIEIISPTLGAWVSTTRAFAVGAVEEARKPVGQKTLGEEIGALRKSIIELQVAQDDMRDENTDLYEENAAVREENAILTEELNRIAEAEQRAREQAAALLREHAQLVEAHNRLLDESLQLRARLDSVIPCTVWGYFSYPRPQTIPPSRRTVVVTDTQAEVFRTQRDCEAFRGGDPTNVSPCFCVGSAWGER